MIEIGTRRKTSWRSGRPLQRMETAKSHLGFGRGSLLSVKCEPFWMSGRTICLFPLCNSSNSGNTARNEDSSAPARTISVPLVI